MSAEIRMPLKSIFCLFIGLMLQGCDSPAPPCGNPVQITWLGVTTYAIQYEYEGETVRLLLDHQINGAYFDEVMANLEFDSVNYAFIGHNHFDHTGHCSEQGDVLCEVSLAAYGEPEVPWISAPFAELGQGRYGAHIVGPTGICANLADDECTSLWAMDGVREMLLEEAGLRVLAFPSAHSQEFGELDYVREHPEDNEPDPFTFIFEFPAADKSCQSSLLWANSTLTKSPYLDYTESLSRDGEEWSFDYRALLQQAMSLRDNKPITYWAFWGDQLPESAWQDWVDIVRPKTWSNHHHGIQSSTYFPDLHTPFPGSPLGGPQAEPRTEWIDIDTNAAVVFLPLRHYWDTVELKDASASLNTPKQVELYTSFQERVTQLLGL